MIITIRPLAPERWRDLEKLFGANGACGGCWCMYWRHPKKEKWDDVKGAANKRRFKELVESGAAHGLVAYADREPAGWVSFDKRSEYPRLCRSPSLRCEEGEEEENVWAIPCFFIKSDYRHTGIASRLLAAAITQLKKQGVEILEGYPVRTAKDGKELPAAFAWTGTVQMFEKAGFRPAGTRVLVPGDENGDAHGRADAAREESGGKLRMRRRLQ